MRASPTVPHRPFTRGSIAAVVLVLLAGVVLGGCSASDQGGTAAAMRTMAPTPMGVGAATDAPAANGSTMAGTPADADAAWAGRPAYVTQDASTEAAYAYALYHPQVIEWMPCYCGCVKLDHRSNLDCYLKPIANGKPTEFEQHASFCGICVQTTLLAKQMAEQGRSLREIRQAVDTQLGGAIQGTDTAQPPG